MFYLFFLILFYSFRSTHKILNCLPVSVQTILFPFMDNILACYKDGTNHTRNCRYFGVVYHLALIVLITGFMWTKSAFILGVKAFVCIVIGMLVAVIRPYKSKAYNIVDIILILSVGLCFAGTMSSFIAYHDDPINMSRGTALSVLPLSVPLLYIVAYAGYQKFCGKKKLFHCIIFQVNKVLYDVTVIRIPRRATDVDDPSECKALT